MTIRSFNAGMADGDSKIRLHLNENSQRFSPRVKAALAPELERCHTYPDPESTLLRAGLAARHRVGEDMVVVGNGCDELILVTALALLGPGTKAAATAGTFPGYKTSASLCGAEVVEVPLRDYRSDGAALARACRGRAALAFLCNPHNPTGSCLDPDELYAFLAEMAAAGAIPVIDEAYIEFAGGRSASIIGDIAAGARAIALRTFSKAYGLGGLRVGYAVGPADLIARLRQASWSLPFRVNRLGQVAALAALADGDHLRRTCGRIEDAKEEFFAAARSRGLRCLPSAANFVMLNVGGDTGELARTLCERDGILVRDCGAFGFPGWVRVSMGNPEEMSAFLAALDARLAAPGWGAK